MDATLSSLALLALISVALIFDFLNGLHDAANSIATVVSTRVLRPQYAVMWAAFFNFIAFLFFGLHVAQTVGTGIVAAEVVDAAVIFGALMGAICWNLITWWLGIPSSSSHVDRRAGRRRRYQGRAGLDRVEWSRHNRRRHCFFPLARLFPCRAAYAYGLVGVRPSEPPGRGQYLPLPAIRLGVALLAGAWRQ